MQIVKRASLLVLVVFAQGLWVTDAAAYSGGITGYSGSNDGITCSNCHYGGADAVSQLCDASVLPLGSFNYSGAISANSNVLRGSNQSITYTMSKVGGTTITKGGMGARINSGSFIGNVNVTASNASGNNTATHMSTSNLPSGTNISWTWNWTAATSFGDHTLSVCGNPTNGDLKCTGDGPHTNTCKTHSFTVVNAQPNAVADGSTEAPFLTVSEDETAYQPLGSVLTNDTDADSGDTKNVNGGPTGAVGDAMRVGNDFSYRPGGVFDYLPTYNPSDPSTYFTDTFTYTITDSTGQSNQTSTADTVFIRVTGVDDPPVANDDGSVGTGFISVTEGATVVGLSVLTNPDGRDIDPDDVEIAVQDATCGADLGPSYASAFTLEDNGTFSYTHDISVQDQAKDSFQYCAKGGSVYSLPATVFIDIVLNNNAPTINNFGGDDDFTTFEEQSPNSIVPEGSISFDDIDSSLLNRAIIEISGANYVAGEDSLLCPEPALTEISCEPFDSGSGQLELTGDASKTDYATAIDRVKFLHSSDNPDTNLRSISLTIRDNKNQDSSTVVRTYTNPIIRTNDSPILDPIEPAVLPDPNIASANAFENDPVGGDPYTFNITAVASDPDVDDDKNDGDASNSLRYSLSNAPTGMTISNAAANPGLISWQPPITGTFGLEYKDITVQVIEVGQIGAVPATQRFTLFVSPPDGDVDGIANYNDTCVTFNDPSNLNTDGDGTPGTDGPGADEGGNECDNDDDGDGISDIDEGLNGLDPLDKNDADLDNDGDGISNRDEIANGTNPNLGNLVIDATGYFTAYELLPPTPTSIHEDATAVTANDYGPYRPGDNTITWTPSNAEFPDLTVTAGLRLGLVSDPPTQPFFIRPLVNFAVNQQVEENDSADITVTVTLNGDSPSWPANPATVSYTVSGTASVADHTAAAGDLTFNDGEYQQTITFRALNDAIADADETVVFTLTDASNAVIGSKNTHTATIVESNVAPMVALQFSQGGVVIGSTYADEVGVITIDALATDVNSAQIPTLSYDWSGTDQLLGPPLATNVSTWPPAIPPGTGTYLIDVVVTDSGAASTRISRILHVAADMAPGNITDFDGDGIPQFLDGDDASTANGNLMPDQTFDLTETLLLETETGLTLRRGSTTLAANRFGALLAPSDIERYGSVNGTPPLNAEDDFEHVGGIYDFEIHGLIPGSSARIVIPLQSGIPKNAVYRKFNPATGWSSFVVDDNNQIASAVGDLGACPEPGSSAYRSGLQYLDNCIQLTIKDGGPNDTDNTVNGVINDPATVGVALKDPQIEEVEEGSGRVSSLLLAILLSLVGFAFWRRRRGFNID